MYPLKFKHNSINLFAITSHTTINLRKTIYGMMQPEMVALLLIWYIY